VGIRKLGKLQAAGELAGGPPGRPGAAEVAELLIAKTRSTSVGVRLVAVVAAPVTASHRNLAARRHGGKANAVFVDGSVRSLAIEESNASLFNPERNK
jgi:prepilin-type processing-associated H-X9-DG protein